MWHVQGVWTRAARSLFLGTWRSFPGGKALLYNLKDKEEGADEESTGKEAE